MLFVPPNWKHMKLAGNGPATSSAKLTWIGDLRVLGRRGAARDGDRRRRLRAVDRRVGAAAELRAHRARVRAVGDPQAVVRERVRPWAQTPYWPPCCRLLTPDQLAHTLRRAVRGRVLRRVGDERVVLVVVEPHAVGLSIPLVAGHSNHWVFCWEFVYSGSPVPAGWTGRGGGLGGAEYAGDRAQEEEFLGEVSHGASSVPEPGGPQIRGFPSLRPRMKVLAIDGGGIRGLIPALVLAEIERRTGRRTADMFDLIAGTSTGGILACGLARRGDDGRPLHSAEELADLYVTEGPKIFDRSLVKTVTSVDGLIDEKYDDKGLNTALDDLSRRRAPQGRAHRRPDHRLRHPRPLRVLLPLLAGAHGRRVRLLAVRGGTRHVGRADLLRARRGHRRRRRPHLPADRRRRVRGQPGDVRLRRGGRRGPRARGARLARHRLADQAVTSTTKVKDWGAIEWVRPVIDMVFDGVADTVDFEAATLAKDRYQRFQAELRYASDALDDASEGNLRRLEGDAERLIAERTADIETLCEEIAG